MYDSKSSILVEISRSLLLPTLKMAAIRTSTATNAAMIAIEMARRPLSASTNFRISLVFFDVAK